MNTNQNKYLGKKKLKSTEIDIKGSMWPKGTLTRKKCDKYAYGRMS
jgi:hypothetical protein